MDKRVISTKDTRRRHSESLKRELVDPSLQPGASVAAIAQEHGINANLLFNWRRLRLRAEKRSDDGSPGAVLLPVTVQSTSAPAVSKPQLLHRASQGVIEIDIGPTRVRLRGPVDEASVRCVLQLLGAIA